jgi:hypothetical protein
MNTIHPHEAPELVDLVALGESSRSDYWRFALTKGREPDETTGTHEVWTVNRGVRLFAADVVFVLDEIEREAARDPAYGDALDKAMRAGVRLVSTRIDVAHQRWDGVHAFPARAVMHALGMDPARDDPYWHNSIPMVVAYALAIGVPRMRIWGCDYTHPDGRILESNRANLEFWLGRARERGMRVQLPPSTTLCNTRTYGGRLVVYGLVAEDEGAHRAFLETGPEELYPGGARVAPIE